MLCFHPCLQYFHKVLMKQMQFVYVSLGMVRQTVSHMGLYRLMILVSAASMSPSHAALFKCSFIG